MLDTLQNVNYLKILKINFPKLHKNHLSSYIHLIKLNNNPNLISNQFFESKVFNHHIIHNQSYNQR